MGSRMQMGFLYLRYVCQPQDLQSWLEPHFGDQTVRCGTSVS
jgi:hypothetical protein